MIASIENGIQVLLTGACTAIAAVRALRTRHRAWILLAMFYGAYFLGDLYWQLFLMFFGRTPEIPFIPDISWYTSYLFLFLLLLHMREGRKPANRFLVLIPAFTAAMAVYYMRYGQYVSNAIYAFLMAIILWQAVGGLTAGRQDPAGKRCRGLYWTTLFFCGMEYGMWTASCIWDGYGLDNPYFYFDFLMNFSFLLFLPALRRAVGR